MGRIIKIVSLVLIVAAFYAAGAGFTRAKVYEWTGWTAAATGGADALFWPIALPAFAAWHVVSTPPKPPQTAARPDTIPAPPTDPPVADGIPRSPGGTPIPVTTCMDEWTDQISLDARKETSLQARRRAGAEGRVRFSGLIYAVVLDVLSYNTPPFYVRVRAVKETEGYAYALMNDGALAGALAVGDPVAIWGVLDETKAIKVHRMRKISEKRTCD